MNSYDVVEHAGSVAIEAEFMGRWREQREAMWADLRTMLPENERIYVYRSAPPPKVLAWWRRMLLRLLGGEA